MKISGWGNYPVIDSQIVTPTSLSALTSLIDGSFQGIPRGMGRSYGDSSLAPRIISTLSLNHLMGFDEKTGLIRCHAGTLLADLLKVFAPLGWFLPVTPGTKFVTVGGAIASDVHGKNHHIQGSFCDHLNSFRLLLASGEVVGCSKKENTELYHSTCGGMGLTGIVLDATFKLKPVRSTYINEITIKTENLTGTLELFENSRKSTYSVAWIDCLSKGKGLGRSLLILGEHAKEGCYDIPDNSPINVPFDIPNFLLNSFTTELFTQVYYHRILKKYSNRRTHYEPYFYPLDRVHHWNRIYGKQGFTQYQFVLPKEAGLEGMNTILERITASQKGSFLSVLKAFGKGNKNLLSFPMEGYTLALDFKIYNGLFKMLDTLDQIVLDFGGRIYLAKDARMSEKVFKQCYPNWEEFNRIRQKYGADKVFRSTQSERLGL